MKKFTVILAIIGFIFGVTGVVGYASIHGSFSSVKIDQTKTINAANINNIQFNSSLAGVHISPAKSNEIKVHLHGGVSKNDIIFTAEANGDTAMIEIRHKTNHMINFFPFDFITNKLQVDLEVPDKVYHQFQAQSQAGSITMNQITADQFNLHSSAGGINVQDTKGNLTAHSSAGSIKLMNTEGKLDLTDSAGSIDVQLKSIKNDIKADCSAGSITIVTEQVPKALQMNLRTSAGHVNVNLPNATFGVKESDKVNGSIGSGGPMVELQSSAGSVTIDKQ